MDKEKVIDKLEKEVKKTYSIKTTIYNNGKKVNEDITEHREPGVKISMEMADEILTLLKEQEPVKAVADGKDSYMCNNCGTVIGWDEWEPGGIEEVRYKFCPECGRQVQWA